MTVKVKVLRPQRVPDGEGTRIAEEGEELTMKKGLAEHRAARKMVKIESSRSHEADHPRKTAKANEPETKSQKE